MENFDAPSIHQMATAAVEFVVRHSLLWYTLPAAASWLLLLVVSMLGNTEKNGDTESRIQRWDVFYLVVLAVFLFARRWPLLVFGDLDGDEGVAVSAALTRYLDPACGVTGLHPNAGPSGRGEAMSHRDARTSAETSRRRPSTCPSPRRTRR